MGTISDVRPGFPPPADDHDHGAKLRGREGHHCAERLPWRATEGPSGIGGTWSSSGLPGSSTKCIDQAVDSGMEKPVTPMSKSRSGEHGGQFRARRSKFPGSSWFGELHDIILGHGVSSFDGEWGFEHPTIRRLTSLRRHQLLPIARNRARLLSRPVYPSIPLAPFAFYGRAGALNLRFSWAAAASSRWTTSPSPGCGGPACRDF